MIDTGCSNALHHFKDGILTQEKQAPCPIKQSLQKETLEKSHQTKPTVPKSSLWRFQDFATNWPYCIPAILKSLQILINCARVYDWNCNVAGNERRWDMSDAPLKIQFQLYFHLFCPSCLFILSMSRIFSTGRYTDLSLNAIKMRVLPVLKPFGHKPDTCFIPLSFLVVQRVQDKAWFLLRHRRWTVKCLLCSGPCDPMAIPLMSHWIGK